MSWMIKVFRNIFPRWARRVERSKQEKLITKIQVIIKPKNQIEFKEIYKPLYDLMNSLPDITSLSKESFRKRYVEFNVASSMDFLKLIDAFIIGDWTKFSTNVDRGLLIVLKKPIRLSDWFSNKLSLDEAFTLISQLLEEVLSLTNVLSDIENDVSMGNQVQTEQLIERYQDFNSSEFKQLIILSFKIIKFLTECYYEDHLEHVEEQANGNPV